MASKNIFLVFVLSFFLMISFAFASQTGSTTGTISGGENNGNATFVVGPGNTNPYGTNNSYYCGDGARNRIEESCDGSDLNGQTCESVLGSGYTGSLSCNSGCYFNTGSCVAPSSTTTTTTETSGGGGGGGGGSSSCTENWVCSEWSVCTDNVQTRTCVDNSNCRNPKLKPAEQRDCTVEGASGEEAVGGPSNRDGKGFWSFLTGAVIGAGAVIFWPILILLVILALVWWYVAKKKNAAGKPIKVKTLSEMRAAKKK